MRNRNQRKLIMYGLMIAVMTTTVAYALLSATLNIEGTVTKKGGSWNISFEDLKGPKLIGDATATTGFFQSTSFSFTASLLKPSDSITYEFNVSNNGSIDAELDTISLTGATAARELDIIYTLTYKDGSALEKGDVLSAGESKGLVLKVEYDENATTVAEEDVVLNLGATLIYAQSIGESGTGGNSGSGSNQLTSVTLTELLNLGRISNNNGNINGMFVGGNIDGEFADITININGNAKITVGYYDTGVHDLTILEALMEDGSIHKITWLGIASSSEFYSSQWGYYIDDVLVETAITEDFVIEGNIQTLRVRTLLSPLKFKEILMEL